jgi:hypothetical protein
LEARKIFTIAFARAQTKQSIVTIPLDNRNKPMDIDLLQGITLCLDAVPMENTLNQSVSARAHGLTAQDLSFPFDRCFWHDRYGELIRSRPIDSHYLTFDETS